jgi:hypothetical protein
MERKRQKTRDAENIFSRDGDEIPPEIKRDLLQHDHLPLEMFAEVRSHVDEVCRLPNDVWSVIFDFFVDSNPDIRLINVFHQPIAGGECVRQCIPVCSCFFVHAEGAARCQENVAPSRDLEWVDPQDYPFRCLRGIVRTAAYCLGLPIDSECELYALNSGTDRVVKPTDIFDVEDEASAAVGLPVLELVPLTCAFCTRPAARVSELNAQRRERLLKGAKKGMLTLRSAEEKTPTDELGRILEDVKNEHGWLAINTKAAREDASSFCREWKLGSQEKAYVLHNRWEIAARTSKEALTLLKMYCLELERIGEVLGSGTQAAGEILEHEKVCDLSAEGWRQSDTHEESAFFSSLGIPTLRCRHCHAVSCDACSNVAKQTNFFDSMCRQCKIEHEAAEYRTEPEPEYGYYGSDYNDETDIVTEDNPAVLPSESPLSPSLKGLYY